MQLTEQLLTQIAWAWAALAVILIPSQVINKAPYGRHISTKWGFAIPNKLGWVIMEIVSLVVLLSCFFDGENKKSPMAIFLVSLWSLHYINRSFIYPFRTKTTGKKIPLTIVLFAMFFNSVNASLNGLFLGSFLQQPTWDSITIFRVGFGFSLFAAGAFINIKSDNILLALRKPGETGYKTPEGFLFKYLSCPNLVGEMVEWIGFAIIAWNIPAFSFAVWTIANLAPRAIHHHQWYKNTFADYPKNRKALLPFLY